MNIGTAAVTGMQNSKSQKRCFRISHLVAAGLFLAANAPILLCAQADTIPRTSLRISFSIGANIASASGAYKEFFESKMQFYFPDYSVGLFAGNEHFLHGSGVLMTAEWTGIPRYGIGIAVATIGSIAGSEARVEGSKETWFSSSNDQYALFEHHTSTGYYAIASYEPWPKYDRPKAAFVSFGAGAGISDIHVRIDVGNYLYDSPQTGLQYRAARPGLMGFCAVDWRLTKALFFGMNISYRWTPSIEFKGGTAVFQTYRSSSPRSVTIPDHTINFSNLMMGFRIGAWF